MTPDTVLLIVIIIAMTTMATFESYLASSRMKEQLMMHEYYQSLRNRYKDKKENI